MRDIKLPDGWKKVKLSDIVFTFNGKYLGKKRIKDSSPYPVYGANGLIGHTDEYKFNEKLITIGRVGSIGSINVISDKCWITDNTIIIKPNENVSFGYILYFLKSIDFTRYKSGTTQPLIKKTDILNIKFMLPPLQTQKRIVQVLERAENAIKKRKEVINLLDELVKSRFIGMFGDPSTNSKGWIVEELSKVLISIDNGRSLICESFSRTGDYPAILKLSAVTYGIYNSTENKALKDEKLFVASVEVRKGDLLFTRKNTPELVGMSAYVYDTAPNLMMPDLIFRLNTNDLCNKIYLWQLINNDLFRENIKVLSNGSAKSMSNISKQRLMSLKIPVPPIELQNQFADFANQVDKLKFEMEKSLEELENVYNSLMQRAFKGELFK